MDKLEYFLKALNAETFIRKDWIISAFAVVMDDNFDETGGAYPYRIVVRKDDNKYRYFIDPENNNEMTRLDGTVPLEPAFKFKDKVRVKPGDLPNIKKPMETTYGNLLFNAMVLCWPFGDKVDYIEGRVHPGKLEDYIASRLEDTPTDPNAQRDVNKIYVDELVKYMEAMASLAGLTQLCAPAATPKSMTIDPAILRRRDELLKEYADQLHDPAILAKIEGELVQMDKDSLKDDPASEFYIKDKSYGVSRKRAFILFGAESGFGDGSREPTVITKSLKEGWDVANLPAMADSLRAGSYYRGNQTALGGESVKYFYRIFQNSKVAEPDCGTTEGLPWRITETNYKDFVGLYQSGVKAEAAMTEEALKGAIGKKIYIRSPMLCKTEAPSFCAKCVGDALAQSPTGLHVAASDVGSTFMLSFMKLMHGKALSVARYRIKDSIS